MSPDQPVPQTQTTNVLSSIPIQAQVPPAQINVPTVIKDVEKVVSEIEKDYKSPAFLFHLAVQVLAWVGYFLSSSNNIKFGSLTLSGVSLLSYFYHLVASKKK